MSPPRTRPALVFALLCGLTAATSPAGDLNPPPGAIAPTMKPLDALLPGTCISDVPGSADAVHLITEPGLYVLTADVVGEPGKSAIAVGLNPALPAGEYRVAINLAGHVVEGVPTADAGLDFRTPAPGQRVVVEVASGGGVTGRVAGFDGPGIRCAGDADLSVSSVHVSQCGGHGIECTGSSRVRLAGVEVSSCTGDGAHLQSVAECDLSVSVTQCGGDGIHASQCGSLRERTVKIFKNDSEILSNALTIEGAAGHGVSTSFCDVVELSDLRVSQCGLDGVHVEDALECRLADVEVADCTGDGIEVLRAAKVGTVLSFKRIHTCDSLRCGGNGVVVTNCGDVDLSLRVEQCGLDGFHATNALRCRVGGEFLDCGGDGVEGDGCTEMAIGMPGMATSKEPKKKKSHTSRVVNPGGNGVLLTGCTEVSLDDLECGDTTLDGVHIDSTGLGVSASVSLGGVLALRCGGDGIDASMDSVSSMEALTCAAAQCTGDGLHVSGAERVHIEDWRDDDCDDGIEVLSGAVSGTHLRVDGALSVGAGSAGLRLLGAVQPVSADLIRVTVRDSFGNAMDARNNIQLGSISVEDYVATRSGGDGLTCDRCDVRLLRLACDDNTQCGARVTNAGSITADSVHGENNGEEGLRVSGAGSGKVSLQDFHFVGNGFALPGGASGLSIDGVPSVQCRNGECRSNAGSGLVVADMDRDGEVDLVVCSSNGVHGVHVASPGGLPNGRCRATRVTCDNNAGDGIVLEATTGGEVSECTLSNNSGVGLSIFGNGHVVRCNSCVTNVGGAMVVPVPGNVVGPLIDELTVGGNCNPAANYVY